MHRICASMDRTLFGRHCGPLAASRTGEFPDIFGGVHGKDLKKEMEFMMKKLKENTSGNSETKSKFSTEK